MPLPASPIPNCYPYVIVDGAHLDGLFYRESVKDPDTLCKCLFDDTPYAGNAPAGPLLFAVEPARNPALSEKLLAIEQETPQAVLWLWSRNEFLDLFAALQSLVFGEQKNGKQVILRYYDPRLLERMLNLFRLGVESRKHLKSVVGWAFLRDGQYQYLD